MELSEVTVEFEETGATPDGYDGWAAGTRVFDAHVTFTVGGKTWSEEFPYHQGPGIQGDPEPRELLSCLASDATLGDQAFSDFCAELGYDEDSRKAHATWEACKASAEKLQAVFGSRFEEFTTTEWDA